MFHTEVDSASGHSSDLTSSTLLDAGSHQISARTHGIGNQTIIENQTNVRGNQTIIGEQTNYYYTVPNAEASFCDESILTSKYSQSFQAKKKKKKECRRNLILKCGSSFTKFS